MERGKGRKVSLIQTPWKPPWEKGENEWGDSEMDFWGIAGSFAQVDNCHTGRRGRLGISSLVFKTPSHDSHVILN